MKNQTTLLYPENYGIYKGIANNEPITIYTNNIIIDNYSDYYNNLLNIFKDGIETEQVQSYMIHIVFTNNIEVDLTLFDYWLNLVMWYLFVATDRQIMSSYLIFSDEFTTNIIKNYIDENLIDICRKSYTNIKLNNIIDDTIKKFHDIELFANYLSNTICLEDSAILMKYDKEFWDCMHLDLSKVPIGEVKSIASSYSNKSIDIIKNKSKDILGYDHCLADAFRAREGINPKQYQESNIIIGPKPAGDGSIFPVIINHSFVNGGVKNPLDYFIDSSVGRTAQIIKFNNVGYSGHFARLLGLNNMDSFLYHDPNYSCGTKNYIPVFIKNEKVLKNLNNRYYRLNPQGIEYLLKYRKDKHLIGEIIYLRSPITCASAASGKGVCYKCYGDLAYTVLNRQTNFGVNIGRIASELLSSKLTQMLLSAKHILEAYIQELSWEQCFYNFFEITFNIIQLLDIDTKNLKLIIDPDNIELENDEDEDLSEEENNQSMYNEYIVEFDIINDKTNESWNIHNDRYEKLYISKELNSIIRKKAGASDGKIVINLDDLKEIPLFVVPVQNNEISKTLNKLKDLLDKNSMIRGKSISELFNEIIETMGESNINISFVHLEMILSNQIRSSDDILDKPDWRNPNEPYQILTLNKALTDNPSITVSLSYQKINRALYNPLTYRKNKPSFMDLFFMKQPQKIIRNIDEPKKETNTEKDENGLESPFEYSEIDGWKWIDGEQLLSVDEYNDEDE